MLLPPFLRRRTPADRVRVTRLASGLVLFVFIAMHLINHALLLVSVDSAEAGREVFEFVWHSWPATILLYGSLLAHFVIVLTDLYGRRTLKMPFREAAQLCLGFLIPLLLISHVVSTRVHFETTGIEATYRLVAEAIWVENPASGLKQSLALLVAWTHGCFGLYFWMRYRRIYASLAPYLLIAAVLLPVLALLGFVNLGRVVQASEGPPRPPIDAAVLERSTQTREVVRILLYGGFALGIGVVFFARGVRRVRQRHNLVRIRYADGAKVDVPRGSSVLEASRIGGIAHYSVCGGKGRCSTCRIQIMSGLAHLPGASRAERATLERIGAGPDVRLACQLRPIRSITVMPLLVPEPDPAQPTGSTLSSPGREADISVLFCDIRSFTSLSESRLPFDVVFLLNRYFAVVGHAVEQAGGRLDKFVGDGAVALFGPAGTSAEEAARQAVEAALQILKDLDRLSDELAGELTGPLRVAIGIHSGPAIVGRMGFGPVMTLTAIGDTVNVASRLETVAKEFDAAIVVSEATMALSGLDFSSFDIREVPIRGRIAPLLVRVVPEGAAPEPSAAKPLAPEAPAAQ